MKNIPQRTAELTSRRDKKGGCAESSRHQIAEKEQSPASQVMAEREWENRGQVPGLPPQMRMEKRGQDQALCLPWRAAAGRGLAASPDRF